MNKNLIKTRLRELPQLDIDAAHAYDQALGKIQDESIRSQLSQCREDHLKHLEALSPMLHGMGVIPPEYSSEFKSFLTSGFTSLRYISGTSGTLKALLANEKLIHQKYREAEELEMEGELSTLIKTHLEDENRHLSYLDEAIDRMYAKMTS